VNILIVVYEDSLDVKCYKHQEEWDGHVERKESMYRTEWITK